MRNCEHSRLKTLISYKLPESNEIFDSIYNVYKNKDNQQANFQNLFKVRHSALMELNNFLFDSEQEKKYDMREEDEAGWKQYQILAERYRIADFFFTRLVDDINKHLPNGY